MQVQGGHMPVDMPGIAALKRFGAYPALLPDMIDRVLPGLGFGNQAAALVQAITAGGAMPEATGDPMDRAVHDGLRQWATGVDWQQRVVRPAHCRAVIVSPQADEALLGHLPPDWSGLLVLCHALFAALRPTEPPAVVATARDDGPRLVEFVAHYRALGFGHVYLYSNDNADGSDALLSLLAEHGVITYIRNDSTGSVSPQRKAFEHSLWKLPELRRHEWVFYPDSDELLVLRDRFGHAITGVLAALPPRPPAAICYHWKWMLSANRYARSDAPLLLESFAHGTPHTLFKSLVRPADVLSLQTLHFPICGHRDVFADSTLAEIPHSRSDRQMGMWDYTSPNYDGGQLNHYWVKSFEEFAVKKRRNDSVASTDYNADFQQFFASNGAETPDRHDPCPQPLLTQARHQAAALRALPGVAEAESATRAAQPHLLETFGGPAALRATYDALMPQQG